MFSILAQTPTSRFLLLVVTVNSPEKQQLAATHHPNQIPNNYWKILVSNGAHSSNLYLYLKFTSQVLVTIQLTVNNPALLYILSRAAV